MSAMLDSFAPDVDLTAEPPVEEEVQTEVKEEPKVEEPKVEEPKVEEPKVESPKEETQQKEQKMVPLAALHEERMRRREIEKESKERFEKLEQRLQLIANPPPPVPKFEEDPAGHLQHQVQTTQAELKAIRESSEQSRQQQEAIQLEQQISVSTQAAEQIFAKDHPDYLDAVKYLQTIADKNLEMMGLEDPIARQAQIRKDALAMSFKALQMGKSPAEVAFNLAVNYGYRKAEPKAEPDAAKKIDAINQGQKTAAMPAGGTKSEVLTLAALEQMDDEEFNKLIDDPSAWKKLVKQMG